MAFIHIPKPWQLPAGRITSESAYWNRRRFIKSAIGAGVGASLVSVVGCDRSGQSGVGTQQDSATAALSRLKTLDFTSNPAFTRLERPTTARQVAATYNNYY
ncbi:MAG: hypothetical protein WBA10_00970 [Elainellaceae cyanobacterium]